MVELLPCGRDDGNSAEVLDVVEVCGASQDLRLFFINNEVEVFEYAHRGNHVFVAFLGLHPNVYVVCEAEDLLRVYKFLQGWDRA